MIVPRETNFMKFLSECPSCGSSLIKEFIRSKDFFLSKEEFRIFQCSACGLKFTNPRPEDKDLSSYYQSEEYLSHSEKNKSFISFAYRTIRKINIKRKFKIVKNYSKGRSILDIGCGTGEFLAYCQKKGMNVTGIEPDKKAKEFATAMHHLEIWDENVLDKASPAFDIVTLWHSLEHVSDINKRFLQIRRVLKPGGTVIIAVPNSDSYDAELFGEFWAAYDLPRHLYHFNQDTFNFIARKFEFSLVKTIPMKWDSFFISLLSKKYRSGRNEYINAVFNGLRSNFHARSHQNNYSSLIFILK